MSKSVTAGQATEKRPAGNGNGAGRNNDEVLRRLEAAMRAAAEGDFSVRLPARRGG